MHRSIMCKCLPIGLVLTLVLQSGYTVSNKKIQHRNETDQKRDFFVESVKAWEYQVEVHEIITQDGYILTAHRMPGRPGDSPDSRKHAVILIHGLFGSSIIWVFRGRGKSLSYSLVDAGYDVWHLNLRGNYYSRRHVELSTEEEEYWKFSWHEHGLYDLAATIDYIRVLTGTKKVTLGGHSMGVIVSFSLLSLRPEYNEKINVVICLAPSVLHSRKPPGFTWSFGIEYWDIFEFIFWFRGLHGLFQAEPTDKSTWASTLCNAEELGKFCTDCLFTLLPFPDFDQYEHSTILKLMHHYPDATSTSNLRHYKQIIGGGLFTQYDYGPVKNLIRYGQSEAPEYPLNKITAPVVLYYGLNDGMVLVTDVDILEKTLPNAISKAVPFPAFNHLDFLLAKDVHELVYDDVIDVINNTTRRAKLV